MRYLCEAYTTGGPIAILQHQDLPLWDGDEDYFRVISRPRIGCLQLIEDFNGRYSICLFYQESDGNFHVSYDNSSFSVLSEISADEGFGIGTLAPAIEAAVTKREVAVVKNFGGKIVIFDSSVAGRAIRLREPGCEQVESDNKCLLHRYDAALIEVNTGRWEVRELYWNDDHLSFSGVHFRLVCPA